MVEPGDWDSATVQADEAQTRQFVTLYEGLQDFDDRAAQAALTIPKLCFAGAADTIEYGPRWGGVTVDLAGPLITHQARLRSSGWTVEILDGLDHVSAMSSSTVLPLVKNWLAITVLDGCELGGDSCSNCAGPQRRGSPCRARLVS